MRFLTDRWHRLDYPDLYTASDWLFFAMWCVFAIAFVIGICVGIVWLLPSI